MTGIPGLIGESAAVRRVAALVRAAAAADVTVLIEGETGTGKEVVARALAALGARAGRPFVAVNCAALADGMLDSELFGHRRGAFTGADGERRGLLESADRGTVFLDEIGTTSPAFQARLLRVLENAEVRAVGSDRARRVDLRVVAASNAPLEDAVARGAFRADLFYRLAVLTIALPPLRERREDVALLVEHFVRGLGGVAGVESAALACLAAHDFPGNVRELRNEIARAAVLAGAGGRIGVEHLSPRVRGAEARTAAAAPRYPPAPAAAMAELERRIVCDALARHACNLTRAARDLGMSRFGLRKRMRRLGVAVRRSLGPTPERVVRLARAAPVTTLPTRDASTIDSGFVIPGSSVGRAFGCEVAASSGNRRVTSG